MAAAPEAAEQRESLQPKLVVSLPKGFRQVLESLTREILRSQPLDILQFAQTYFERLVQSRDDGLIDMLHRAQQEDEEAAAKGNTPTSGGVKMAAAAPPQRVITANYRSSDVGVHDTDPVAQGAVRTLQGAFRSESGRLVVVKYSLQYTIYSHFIFIFPIPTGMLQVATEMSGKKKNQSPKRNDAPTTDDEPTISGDDGRAATSGGRTSPSTGATTPRSQASSSAKRSKASSRKGPLSDNDSDFPPKSDDNERRKRIRPKTARTSPAKGKGGGGQTTSTSGNASSNDEAPSKKKTAKSKKVAARKDERPTSGSSKSPAGSEKSSKKKKKNSKK